jgi:tetratricopeptide (TPR) repeat protein
MARLHKKLQAEETSRVFARLADTFRRSDHLEEAIELCHRGLVHHPEYVSGHIVLGQCYLDLGRLEEARDCFVRALALDADNILTLRSLGTILFQQGELEEAAERYRQALRLEPGNRDLQELLRETETRLAERSRPQEEPDPEDLAEAVGADGGSGTREEEPGTADEPALSGTAMMSVPAFGREVLKPTDTEEHRRWLRKMTSEPPAGNPDEDDPAPEETEEDRSGDAAESAADAAAESAADAAESAADAAGESDAATALQDGDPESMSSGAESEDAGARPESSGGESEDTGAKPISSGADSEDAAAESRNTGPDPKDEMTDAHLSPEETELLRDQEDEHPAKGPPRGMATATLAEIYFQQGYVDKAIEIYLKVLRHDPGDEKSRARLSELRAMRAGRSEDHGAQGDVEQVEEKPEGSAEDGKQTAGDGRNQTGGDGRNQTGASHQQGEDIQ